MSLKYKQKQKKKNPPINAHEFSFNLTLKTKNITVAFWLIYEYKNVPPSSSLPQFLSLWANIT